VAFRRLDEADGLVHSDRAMAGDQDHGTVVAAAPDVVFDDGLQVL
jgi:hypothetical protein